MRRDLKQLQTAFDEDGAILVRGIMDPKSLTEALRAYEWSLANPGPGASRFAQTTDATFYQDLWNPNCITAYRDMLLASPLPQLVADIWGTPEVWFMYE